MRNPRIDHVDIQVGKVFDVARGKARSTCDDNPGNLRIAHINRLGLSLPASRKLCGRLCSRLIKVEYAPLQVFNQEIVKGRL
jgi:hypothetical protein